MDSAGFGLLVVVVHSIVRLGMPNKPKQVLHPQYHLQCVIGHVWLQDKPRGGLESIDNTVYATISKANWNKT